MEGNRNGIVLWLHSSSDVDGRMVAMRVRRALLEFEVPVLSIDPVELGAVVVPAGLSAPVRRDIQRSVLVQTAYLAAQAGAVVIVIAGLAEEFDRDRVRGGVPAFVLARLRRSGESEAKAAPPLAVGISWDVDLDATPAAEVVRRLLEAIHQPRSPRFASSAGPVSCAMSLIAVFVHPDDPVAAAKQLVQQSGFRHLPVLEDGRAVGMITIADLYALECVPGNDVQALRIADVMSRDVLSVDVSTPIEKAAQEMADRRVGSAVVTENGQAVGIFTASNACWVLGHGRPEEGPRVADPHHRATVSPDSARST